MNGAQCLLETLVASSVEVCFSNPGTSEMHFVAALDEVEGMRCILGLFEGGLSGAADGYARMARKPACTLLHLGPGLGNALANIHNARKGRTPLVNIVGDHATYHLEHNAPLTSDIVGLARPVSDWVRRCALPESLAADTAEGVAKARAGQVATLILPADVSWSDSAQRPALPAPVARPQAVPASRVAEAARRLRASAHGMLMIGGREVDLQRGLMLSRVGRAVGARVSTDTFPARVARGAGSAALERLPYLAEQAIDHIAEVDQLVLVGIDAPVSFFAYPDVPSEIASAQCEVFPLAGPDEDIDQALEGLLEALEAVDVEPDVLPLELPPLPGGPLSVGSAAAVLCARLQENTIVVDEGITCGLACFGQLATANAHDWLNQTGGAIGWGLPAAVGAAVACPDRPVVVLEGDGSAMYTLQSLWTMAREQLDITVLVFNNGAYRILELEFGRTGARGGVPGPKAASNLNLGNPPLDFVALAGGMGVPAARVESADAFAREFDAALAAAGPHLIELMMP